MTNPQNKTPFRTAALVAGIGLLIMVAAAPFAEFYFSFSRLLLKESLNIFHPDSVFFQRTRNLPSSNSLSFTSNDCHNPSFGIPFGEKSELQQVMKAMFIVGSFPVFGTQGPEDWMIVNGHR
jgi:hypothetical protein